MSVLATTVRLSPASRTGVPYSTVPVGTPFYLQFQDPVVKIYVKVAATGTLKGLRIFRDPSVPDDGYDWSVTDFGDTGQNIVPLAGDLSVLA